MQLFLPKQSNLKEFFNKVFIFSGFLVHFGTFDICFTLEYQSIVYLYMTEHWGAEMFFLCVCFFPSEKSQRWRTIRTDHVPFGHSRERLFWATLHGLGTGSGKNCHSSAIFYITWFVKQRRHVYIILVRGIGFNSRKKGWTVNRNIQYY